MGFLGNLYNSVFKTNMGGAATPGTKQLGINVQQPQQPSFSAPIQGPAQGPTQAPRPAGLPTYSAPMGGGLGPVATPNLGSYKAPLQQTGSVGKSTYNPSLTAPLPQGPAFTQPVAPMPNPGVARVTDSMGRYNNGSGQRVGLNGQPIYGPAMPSGGLAPVPAGGVDAGQTTGQAVMGFMDGSGYDAYGNPIAAPVSTNYGSQPITGAVNADTSNGTYNSSAFSSPVTNSYIQDLIDNNKKLRDQVLQYAAPGSQEAQTMQDLAAAKATSRNYNVALQGGIKNIWAKPIALDFQQGQAAAMTRDAAYQQLANSTQEQNLTDYLDVQQKLRQGLLNTFTTALGFGQQDITNRITMQNQANQLTQTVDSGGRYLRYTFDSQGNPTGVQDMGPAQDRYIQITDPNTGFPAFYDQSTRQIVNPFTGGSSNPGVGGGIGANAGAVGYGAYGNGTNAPGVVRGVDLGAGKVMGPYANASGSDKTNYNYANTIGTLADKMPDFHTAADIQGYIASVAPKSPVTGAMVASAANQYGVDPQVLTAVLQQESSFGTKGVGARTFNPGNVGNVNSGATRDMGSWQAGVNAVAQNLARRTLPASQQQPANTGAGMVNNYGNSTQQQQIAQLPAIVQQYAVPGPSNSFYVNIDKVPTNLQQAVKTQASLHAVPVFDSSEVGKIRNIEVVQENLNAMKALVPQVLGGHVTGTVLNRLRSNSNTNIDKLRQYRTTALNSIQGLAGGEGSGFRLNAAEIASATSNLPTEHDTIQAANAKIQGINDQLNRWVAELLPNSSIAQSSNYVKSLGL